MKKFVKIFLMLAIVLLLSSCSDKKFYDTSINVSFYTGKNATQIPTLYDLEPYSTIDEPAPPTRPGYAFVGWYKEASYKTPWNFATDNVGDRSFIIFAKWEPITYQIIYHTNGGTLTGIYPETFNLDSASTTIFPTSIRMTGYSFVGWFLYDWKDENGKIQTKPGDPGIMRVPDNYAQDPQDIHLYAHWKVIEVPVSFDINFPEETGKPEAPKSFTIKYGDTINFDEPVAEGYRFLGWNLKADGSGEYLVNGTKFTRTQNTKVYAIWEKIN